MAPVLKTGPRKGRGFESYRLRQYPGVVQLIERVVWDHEAVGLSPTTRTTGMSRHLHLIKQLQTLPCLTAGRRGSKTLYAEIAQQAERCIRNAQVLGSNPNFGSMCWSISRGRVRALYPRCCSFERCLQLHLRM